MLPRDQLQIFGLENFDENSSSHPVGGTKEIYLSALQINWFFFTKSTEKNEASGQTCFLATSSPAPDENCSFERVEMTTRKMSSGSLGGDPELPAVVSNSSR